MAARAVAARPWRTLRPAALWVQPHRLQHEQLPEQSDQSEKSLQTYQAELLYYQLPQILPSKVKGPIEMENPYKEPPKRCILCGINVDYKNVQLLSQFVSPHTGRIYGRHITGLCNKKQKEITKAIKRAQVIGFMPVMFKNPAFLTDPKICNIKYPE